MMKKLTTILAVLFLGTFLVVGSAMAVSFSFSGNYTITDTNNPNDNFAETLSFDSPLTLGSGAITEFDPDPDGIISVGDYIVLPDLIFDQDNYESGKYYFFNPTTYTQGFQVYDYNSGTSTLLFSADLNVDK
jgi:hypothetical protein